MTWLDGLFTGAQDFRSTAKPSVRAASVGAVTANGVQTVDGVALVAGDRVLLKNQGSAAANGIYVVNASGAWSRAQDAIDGSRLVSGSFVFVQEGAANAGKQWQLTTPDPISVGVTSQTWEELQGGGSTTAPIYLNAADYGVVGDGVADTRDAVQDALADASALANLTLRPVTLFFPAGRYRCVVAVTDLSSSLNITGSIDVVGAGRDVTQFYIEPSTTPTSESDWYWGFVVAANKNASFSKLAMLCATAVLGTIEFSSFGNKGPLQAIRHEGGASNLRVEDCLFNGPDGGWGNCITHSSGGAGTLTVSRCILNGHGPMVSSWTVAAEEKAVYLTGNSYHQMGATHCVYTHPIVALRAANEYVGPSAEYPNTKTFHAYYKNTNTALAKSRPPAICSLTDVTVVNDYAAIFRSDRSCEPAVDDGILLARATSTSAQTGVVPDGSFGTNQFNLRNVTVTLSSAAGQYVNGSTIKIYGAVVNGTYPTVTTWNEFSETLTISGTGGGVTLTTSQKFSKINRIDIAAQAGTGGSIKVGLDVGEQMMVTMTNVKAIGCYGLLNFAGDAIVTNAMLAPSPGGQIANGGIYFRDTARKLTVKFVNSYFDCSAMLAQDQTQCTRGYSVQFTGCTFKMSGSGSLEPSDWVFTPWVADASHVLHDLRFDGCEIIGRNKTRMIWSNTNVAFYGCQFKDDGANAWIDIVNPTVTSTVVTAPTVQFWNCSQESVFNLYAGSSSANVTNPTLLGADNRCPGQAFRAKTAGSTNKYGFVTLPRGLSPTSFGSTAEMVLPTMFGDTWHITGTNAIDYIYIASGDNTYCLATRLYLIADAAWSTTTAGNIVPRTTAARTVNGMYCFQYDPFTRKWYEQA